MASDMRRVIRELKKQGFTVGTTTKGHIEVRDSTGKRVATTPGTPSDWRAFRNFIAALRRAGFHWPH